MKKAQQANIVIGDSTLTVPYMPVGATTSLVGGEEVVNHMVPPYVTALEQFAETKSPNALNRATLSVMREIAINMVRASAIEIEGIFEAPIALSDGVAPGHFYVTKDRIILNQHEALARFVDADGDRAILVFHAGRKKAVLVKYPITMHPLILTRQQDEPKEIMHDLTDEFLKSLLEKQEKSELTPEVEEQLFKKAHMDVPIGLMTTHHNVKDLLHTNGWGFGAKVKEIYNTFVDNDLGLTQRAIDIEMYGMKAVRKDGDNKVVAIMGSGQSLAYKHAYLLTSSNSIGSARRGGLNWTAGDLHKTMREAMSLQVEFRDVKPNEDTLRLVTNNQQFNKDLLIRLINLRLISWTEIPSAHPDLPPSVILYLQRPNGHKVALTDVKRNDQPEGLTYGFLLAPVFDAVDLVDQYGKVITPATYAWTHPINHLAKMACTFDNRILWDGEPRGHWPKNMEDFHAPKRAIKAKLFTAWLTDYCQQYGDPVPATMVDGELIPSPMALGVIKRSAVIDYGRPMTEGEMWPIAKQASSLVRLCLGGSKAKDRRVRKYMLANAKGGCILDTENICHPARPGKNRSQLIRALKSISFTIAIVNSETLNQAWITPKGIEKQLSEIAFLPRVFDTREAYLEFLSYIGLEESQAPCTTVDFFEWTGAKRRCFVIDPRSSIEVGKFIDISGNKLMPRKIESVSAIKPDRTGDLLDIDMIIPVHELVEKGNLEYMLKNLEPMDIIVNDQAVRAFVGKKTLYRSGSPSENIPARTRTAHIKGMDSFPIQMMINRMNEVEDTPRQSDLSFPLELQVLLHQLISLENEYAEEEQE